MNLFQHFAALVTSVTLVSLACAQSPETNACQSPEFRQLDFWEGDWIGTWETANGEIASATNLITKHEFGDCVIIERFSMSGFSGMSISTYHAPVGLWRQTWVDDQGGYFALVGGVSGEPGVAFELELSRLNDQAPYRRMIWQDVSESDFVWRWQHKTAANAEWQDSWVINYERRHAP